MYIGNGSETANAAALCSLRSRKGGNNEIYQGLAMNGDEHGKNSKNPNVDLFYGVTGTYGCWRVAEIAAVYLVTSG